MKLPSIKLVDKWTAILFFCDLPKRSVWPNVALPRDITLLHLERFIAEISSSEDDAVPGDPNVVLMLLAVFIRSL